MTGAEGSRGWRPFPGGSPFNIALAVARLGVSAGFLSRLSRDLFGDQLMTAMQDNKVDTALVRRSDEPSTLAFVDAAPLPWAAEHPAVASVRAATSAINGLKRTVIVVSQPSFRFGRPRHA